MQYYVSRCASDRLRIRKNHNYKFTKYLLKYNLKYILEVYSPCLLIELN